MIDRPLGCTALHSDLLYLVPFRSLILSCTDRPSHLSDPLGVVLIINGEF